jgi:hypothetical protein
MVREDPKNAERAAELDDMAWMASFMLAGLRLATVQ